MQKYTGKLSTTNQTAKFSEKISFLDMFMGLFKSRANSTTFFFAQWEDECTTSTSPCFLSFIFLHKININVIRIPHQVVNRLAHIVVFINPTV